MFDLITAFFRRWWDEVNLMFGQWTDDLSSFLKLFLRPTNYFRVSRVPPIPFLFLETVDFALLTFDLVLDSLSVTPFLALAGTLLDHFKVPGKLRQRVMTLDQASILVARVIVDQGLKLANDPLPQEFVAQDVLRKVAKVDSLIRKPSLKKFWGILFGSLWGRILRLLLLVFTWGKMVGLTVLLWNWMKAVNQPRTWQTLFSGALSQSNPRQKQTTTLTRRVGGVPP